MILPIILIIVMAAIVGFYRARDQRIAIRDRKKIALQLILLNNGMEIPGDWLVEIARVLDPKTGAS